MSEEVPARAEDELLVQEYKLAQSKAEHLERNVYYSATVFGIGSAAALAALVLSGAGVLQTLEGTSAFVVFGVSLLIITTWLTWLRLSLRWLSIANVMFIRMEHIERQTGLRVNLYVRHVNKENSLTHRKHEGSVEWTHEEDANSWENPFLPESAKDNLVELTETYEHRSQISMLKFLAWTNIGAWSLLAIFGAARVFVPIISSYPYSLLGIVLAVIVSAYIAFLINAWKDE